MYVLLTLDINFLNYVWGFAYHKMMINQLVKYRGIRVNQSPFGPDSDIRTSTATHCFGEIHT